MREEITNRWNPHLLRLLVRNLNLNRTAQFRTMEAPSW